jgi:hypothetical protein
MRCSRPRWAVARTSLKRVYRGTSPEAAEADRIAALRYLRREVGRCLQLRWGWGWGRRGWADPFSALPRAVCQIAAQAFASTTLRDLGASTGRAMLTAHLADAPVAIPAADPAPIVQPQSPAGGRAPDLPTSNPLNHDMQRPAAAPAAIFIAEEGPSSVEAPSAAPAGFAQARAADNEQPSAPAVGAATRTPAPTQAEPLVVSRSFIPSRRYVPEPESPQEVTGEPFRFPPPQNAPEAEAPVLQAAAADPAQPGATPAKSPPSDAFRHEARSLPPTQPERTGKPMFHWHPAHPPALFHPHDLGGCRL